MSRCKHRSSAAKIPGPHLSSSPLRLHALIFKGQVAKGSCETFSCWTGATDPSLLSRYKSPSPTVSRNCRDLATLRWNGLNSLSHHESYFKILESKKHKLNQKVKLTRGKKEVNYNNH